MSSVRIGGTTLYRVKPWPKPSIKSSIQWTFDSRGNPRGYDRGASEDIYETSIEIEDTETNVNSLLTVLNSNRETVTLDQFAADIFAPNIDYTGSIVCAVNDYGVRKVGFHATSGDDIYQMELKLRAVQPSVLGTTPSLSGIRVQEQRDAGHSFGVARHYFRDGAHGYSDTNVDSGRYAPYFLCTPAIAKAVIAYFMVTARAASFTLPTLGDAYPFGPSRGSGPFTVRLHDFSISRENLNRWRIDCDFREIG